MVTFAIVFLAYVFLAVFLGRTWAKFRWDSWLAWEVGLPSAAVTERVGRHPFWLRLRMGLLWPFFFNLFVPGGGALYALEVRQRPDEFDALVLACREKDEAKKFIAYQRYERLTSFLFPVQFFWSFVTGLIFLSFRFVWGTFQVVIDFLWYWAEYGFRFQGWRLGRLRISFPCLTTFICSRNAIKYFTSSPSSGGFLLLIPTVKNHLSTSRVLFI